MTKDVWEGYLLAADRDAIATKLRAVLAPLPPTDQCRFVEEGWAWLWHEGPF
jgi:hypothetical protein